MIGLKLKKIENETEKKIILLMMERDYESKAEVGRAVGKSKMWASRLINRLEENGVVVNKKVRDGSVFHLDKKKVVVKTLSFELLKQLMTLPTIGVLLCFSVAFLFKLYGWILILGGLIVFSLQFSYAFYKIYGVKDADSVDIFIKTKGK